MLVNIPILVDFEGNRCKSKTALTKPPHLTPTYATPKTYTYDTWTQYMINLNPYVNDMQKSKYS